MEISGQGPKRKKNFAFLGDAMRRVLGFSFTRSSRATKDQQVPAVIPSSNTFNQKCLLQPELKSTADVTDLTHEMSQLSLRPAETNRNDGPPSPKPTKPPLPLKSTPVKSSSAAISSSAQEKENESLLCIAILMSGQRKGLRCGKSLPCKYHKTKPIIESSQQEEDVAQDISFDFSADMQSSPPASPLNGLTTETSTLPTPVTDTSDSTLLCKAIIIWGTRKGDRCGKFIPCKYHKVNINSGEQSPCPASSSSLHPQLVSLADAPTPERKHKVTVRLVDHNSQQMLRTALDECLRERALRKRTLPILKEHYGEGCYYLRHTEARASSLAAEHYFDVQVDHTFECQLIAHAVVQCPDYTEILRQYDHQVKNNLLTKQGFVVQGALKPVYDIQNNIHETELFNLRLLHPTLNMAKVQHHQLIP